MCWVYIFFAHSGPYFKNFCQFWWLWGVSNRSLQLSFSENNYITPKKDSKKYFKAFIIIEKDWWHGSCPVDHDLNFLHKEA